MKCVVWAEKVVAGVGHEDQGLRAQAPRPCLAQRPKSISATRFSTFKTASKFTSGVGAGRVNAPGYPIDACLSFLVLRDRGTIGQRGPLRHIHDEDLTIALRISRVENLRAVCVNAGMDMKLLGVE